MCHIALAVCFVCVTQYPLDTLHYCSVWWLLNQCFQCFHKFKSQLNWSWQNQGLQLKINCCQWKNSFIAFIIFFIFFHFTFSPDLQTTPNLYWLICTLFLHITNCTHVSCTHVSCTFVSQSFQTWVKLTSKHLTDCSIRVYCSSFCNRHWKMRSVCNYLFYTSNGSSSNSEPDKSGFSVWD